MIKEIISEGITSKFNGEKTWFGISFP